jgi:hypothetical protein
VSYDEQEEAVCSHALAEAFNCNPHPKERAREYLAHVFWPDPTFSSLKHAFENHEDVKKI